jgi:hypothetical protein
MQLRSVAWTHGHMVTQVEFNVSRAEGCSYIQLLGHMVTQVESNVSRDTQCSYVYLLGHMDTVTQVESNVSRDTQCSYVYLLGHMDTRSHRLNLMCQEQGNTVTFKCLDTWTHGNKG